jgi:tetratricopeptide (TPR) repeat protein
VGSNLVVTNCHGTHNARWIDVMARGRDWKVTRVVEDVERDLCLLEIESDILDPFTLAGADAQPQLGDHVVALGFAGRGVTVAQGTVNALYTHDQAAVIQTDAAFARGESGGALLDRQGRLVGVLTFFARANRGGFFAMPARWVEELVQRAGAGQPEPAQPEVAFWQRPDPELPPFLRAVARESAGDWEGVKLIAQQWVAHERLNPEAWVALGKAYHHVTQPAQAAQALVEGLRLAPRHTLGWYYLGRARLALNDMTGLDAVLRRLDLLDPGTARSLRDAMRMLQ